MVDINCNGQFIKNIDAVIWDKDGTIIDAHIYWGEIIKRRVSKIIEVYNLNKNLYPEICKSLGYDLITKRLLPEGPIALLSRNEVIENVLKFLKTICPDITFDNINEIFTAVHNNFKNDILNYIEIIPFVKETLESFKENNITQILLTSDTKENAEICLSHLGLKDYFTDIIGKNESSYPKKSGKPADYIINKLNLKNTICIGDAKMDADMAKNSKILEAILVASGQTPLNKLFEYSNYCIKNLNELIIMR